VNSQQAQIQELIQSIDAVLSKASPRLPWVMAGESEQQRQLLERTRQYLVGLQQSSSTAELPGAAPLGALPADPTLGPVDATPAPSPGESAQQVLQAVLQEVTYLRTNIMQPMRSEVDDLRVQRDSLVSEIKELEAQRQQYALPPQADSQQQQQALGEFLQSLMGRLQENLTVQVAEMLTTLESRTLPPANTNEVPAAAANHLTGSYLPPLTPQERLAQLQQIQTQSDQLLLKLDTTLRVIFESLQRNIQTYEDSLSQGLDKMHTLGHQGEAIFTALVNRLAQQLGREASQYLQSSLEGTDWQALPGGTGRPLAGLSRAPGDTSSLDSLMDELAESEATILQPPTGMPSMGLDGLNQEIDQLELTAPPQGFDDLDAGEMTMFQMDENLMATRFQDEDMTIFQINEAAIAPLQEVPLDDALGNDIDDIDSALELLNQISSDLETESEEEATATSEVASPEGLYDELDALYNSLFGTDVAPEDQVPPVDRHVADAEQAIAETEATTDWAATERAEALDDFESQFFGGLADLSESAAATAFVPEDELEVSEAGDEERRSPQTLESLLFDEVPAADEGEQEDTQLLGISEGGGQNLPADVIASLEDLIALSDAASLDALRSEGSLVDEDIYIPASPEEDLLSETVTEAPRVEISVDADMLQQLDAELSSLEGREPDLDTVEDISFLSDLSEEPEDISTSLELVFQDMGDEAPLSPATTMQEDEALPSFDISDLETAELEAADLELEAAELEAEDLEVESQEFGALVAEDLELEAFEADLAEANLTAEEAIPTLEFQADAEALSTEEPSPDELELDVLLDTDLDDADLEDVALLDPDPDDTSLDDTSLEQPAEGFDAEELSNSLESWLEEASPEPTLDSSLELEAIQLMEEPFPDLAAETLSTDELDISLDRWLEDSSSTEPIPDQPLGDDVFEVLEEQPSEPPAETLDTEDFGVSLESWMEEAAPAEPALEESPTLEVLERLTEEALPPPTSDDLLESLLDEIPPEVFEEENLPRADAALLNRLLDEEEGSSTAAPVPAEEVAPEQERSESPEDADLSGDNDWLLFGADLPELSDSAPPPPPILLEEGDQPPFEETPEETAAFLPPDIVLPPDREDLTLENFQMVMATPPLTAEDALLEWPGDEGSEPLPLAELTAPDATPAVAPDLSLDFSLEDSTDNRLDGFTSELNLEQEGNGAEANFQGEDTAAPLELASWFESVEDVPPSIEVDPPASQLTSLEDASAFLEALTTDSSPAPIANDNTFTLDGLGDLFEALPDSESIAPPDASSSPPEVSGDTAPEQESLDEVSNPALGTDFGLAGIDLYDTPPDADPEAAKKKDLDDRPPEDLAPPIAPVPPDAEAAIAPEALDYTSDLILQAIGFQADEEDTVDLLEEELDLAPEEEPDLALVELTADLLEEEEDEVDSDLATLLQRLQGAPAEVDAPGDLLSDRLSLLREQEDDLESLIFSVTDTLEDDFGLFPEMPLPVSARRSPRSPWYLGIDLGTTGISAVLMNRQTAALYPLFWLEIKFPGPSQRGIPIPEKTYRLPTAVYVTPVASSGGGTLPEVAIASLSITRQEFRHPTRQPVRDVKPALRAGIPYYTLDQSHWEPVLQWSDQRTIPLSVVHQALRALLSSLNYTSPEPQEGSDAPVLSCGAVGLPDEELQKALQELAGVVVSHPANWSDTYRFNVREAILAARLVENPAHIYLVEESVATLLSALHPVDTAIALPDTLTPRPDLFQARWQGGTLIINGGASVTELALVNLPDRLQILTHPDFAMRTLPYGGNALDQDVICQLIYPAWIRQAHRPDVRSAATQETGPTLDLGDDLDWADPWAALGWEHLTLPVVGDPDLMSRQVLQQRLQGASVGLGLLEAARYLKLTLQQQERCTLILGDLSLTMSRQDLGSRVLLPYIQRLNRELNGLLTQTGTPAFHVNQVLCSGGSASLAAIARWLRQKLPNATIVQDTYAQAETPQHNHLTTCSRVAYGLATAPLYPQVLDQSRHRYSDYFLLMELLRIFPEEPTTLDNLLTMLARRGIDTETCRPSIVALLEGHLPAGLVPADWEAVMLTPASQHNPDYQALLAAPLFVREADQTYRPNPQQWQVFRRYLDNLLATSYQKLTEPLDFVMESIQTR